MVIHKTNKKKNKKKDYISVGWKTSRADKVEQIDHEVELGDVEKELEEEGVIAFTNDQINEEYLQLPMDITEVPSRELGKYLNAFTQQKMYVRTLYGRVRASLRGVYEKLDDMRSLVYADLPVKMSVKEKDLVLRKKIVEKSESTILLEQVAYYEEKLKILADYLESLIDGIFNISREISRRGDDFNNENRNENIDKKRRR